MTVYETDEPDVEKLEASAQNLQMGEPKVVVPGQFHKYVVGDEQTVLKVTLTSGDLEFESLLKVMNGLAEDGEFGEDGG